MRMIIAILRSALAGDVGQMAHLWRIMRSSWPEVAGGTVRATEAPVKASDGEVSGKPDFCTLTCMVTKAIQEDPRWDTDQHGYPEGSDGDLRNEPYCMTILAPDDDGSLEAVIRTDDGRIVRHAFTWDGETVTMADGDSAPTEMTTIYSRIAAAHDEYVKAGDFVGHPFREDPCPGKGYSAHGR